MYDQEILSMICKDISSSNQEIHETDFSNLQIHLVESCSSDSSNFEANEELLLKIRRACIEAGIEPLQTGTEQFLSLIGKLSESPPEFVPELSDRELKQVATYIQTVDEPDTLKGRGTYEVVLKELDRLKDRLEGSPNYNGKRPPPIDKKDRNRTFLGFPLTSVKTWIRMTLKKGYRPRAFWRLVAKKIFGISEKNEETQYEYTAQAIQRFGIVTANKEKFFAILDSEDSDEYLKFSQSTGLLWHRTQNDPGVEKLYVNFLHEFLTTHFEQAKSEGDDALLEYFRAFDGVCFEDRAPALEAFVIKKSSQKDPVATVVASIADYDSSSSATEVFDKELAALVNLEKTQEAIPHQKLFTYLTNKDVFATKFTTAEGNKELPSIELFHDWVLEQQSLFIVTNYQQSEFLDREYAILKQSEKEVSFEEFFKQCKERAAKRDEDDPILFSDPGNEDVEFQPAKMEKELKTWFTEKQHP